MPIETCAGCGFDAADYTRTDRRGTLRAIPAMWRTMIEGIDETVLVDRPAPDVWSALEYATHSRDVTALLVAGAQLALAEDHPRVPTPPASSDPELPQRPVSALDELEDQLARLSALCKLLTPDEWMRPITIGHDTVDVEWIVGHAVHDAIHHLHDVGRGLHALGWGAPAQRGTLAQINASGGGVPKTPLTTGVIRRRGLAGDVQALPVLHGLPHQALSLWSADVIAALNTEGHMLYAGAAGENLTVTGIEWATIRPGVRIRIGEVQAEISTFATPCAKNARWFSDGDFRRIDHSLHPGTSRAYAWVLEAGFVRPGDAVLVES